MDESIISKKSRIKNLSKVITVNHGHRPRLVILDEPFSGLDPVNVELLIETVKKLKAAGTAIIFPHIT